MKKGDLVKHAETMLNAHPKITKRLGAWLGIIVEFDEDGDPVVQWFENGEFLGPADAEFKNTIEVI
jgi:hypothetical protein|tara:strand:+ start:295 stop:492 length:198 start_codon:yes stop_codon:yes gene_type:complete